jgi:hypothetical protein
MKNCKIVVLKNKPKHNPNAEMLTKRDIKESFEKMSKIKISRLYRNVVD